MPKIRFQCSKFVENEQIFLLQETMYNYNKTQPSPYNPTKLAIHSIMRPEDKFISNCGQNFKKSVSFEEILHFNFDENIVPFVEFDCGFTFYPGTPTKIRQFNQERNYLSRSFEKTMSISSNDQDNCSNDKQHTSSIFSNPYIIWDMVPAALMSLNDENTMSNQYPQPTTHLPRTDSCPVISSLRTMDSERKGLRVSFAFFQRNYLPDGRVNETVTKFEELSDLWKPGAEDPTPPILLNCN